MRLKITDMPDDIIQEYKLMLLVTQDRYVYCEITQGMYGLLQAGIIAQELLEKRLAEYGYHQSKIINFWKHNTRPICFALVVDDFAVCVCVSRSLVKGVQAVKHTIPIANSCPC